MLAYGNGEEDDAFFNPLQAYDDLAELVVRCPVYPCSCASFASTIST